MKMKMKSKEEIKMKYDALKARKLTPHFGVRNSKLYGEIDAIEWVANKKQEVIARELKLLKEINLERLTPTSAVRIRGKITILEWVLGK